MAVSFRAVVFALALAGTTVSLTGQSALPPGVTLRDIDGGPTYYADHGFTYAVNAGWDNPSFFPIGLFLEKINDQTQANTWKDLNLNLAIAAQAGDVNLSVMRSNSLNLIAQADELSTILSRNGGALGSETVGILAFDEPGTHADAIGAIQTVSNTHQNNRFWYENFLHNQVTDYNVQGYRMDDLLKELIATPNSTRRHLDVVSVDNYWVGGASASFWQRVGQDFYNLGGRSMTPDEMRRGCRYGDMLDSMRLGIGPYGYPPWQSTYPAPMAVFVETAAPYREDSTAATAIRPAEINAAVWSTIIKGARYIAYFSHSDAGVGDSLIAGTFWKTPLPGESVSNYSQIKATNALVKSLAPVINSPFADGYVTVSPPPVRLSSTQADAGYDVMAKYHNVSGGDNKFYIFAMPRWSPSLSNRSATFTIKNTGSTQVTVINENRTIPVTNGTQFTDTFATAHTVHIYRVDSGPTTGTRPPLPPTGVRVISGGATTSCPSGQIGTYPDCFPLPPAPSASGKQWAVVYAEEFNGTSLDTTKLTPCFDWNYGDCTTSFNAGKERYLPAQVRVSNGTAKLVAEPLSPPYANSGCYAGQCTYKAGLVSTARPRADNGSAYLFPFTYGYVESRMKFPATPGFFTAFWMLPTEPSFSYDTEIDIVEILGGHPDTIFMNYHYSNRGSHYTPNNGLHNNGACAVKDYSADFVRFGLDWQPSYVAWYIDGVKCGQFNGDTTSIENGPMQVILHMMVDNSWERDWGSVLSSQTLVGQLEVDYLRIYQQR